MEHEADVFSREPNGLIALRITQDEWIQLLHVFYGALGFAARVNDRDQCGQILRLLNRLNEGNPNYDPAEMPAAEAQP